jgi:hypothetical protein
VCSIIHRQVNSHTLVYRQRRDGCEEADAGSPRHSDDNVPRVRCKLWYVNPITRFVIHIHFRRKKVMRWSSAIAGGHDVETTTTPASGLRWPSSPNAEKTMLGSSDINVILCLKAQCAGYKSCYCCFTLPGLPCWPDQKTCWQECPSHKRLWSTRSMKHTDAMPSIGPNRFSWERIQPPILQLRVTICDIMSCMAAWV